MPFTHTYVLESHVVDAPLAIRRRAAGRMRIAEQVRSQIVRHAVDLAGGVQRGTRVVHVTDPFENHTSSSVKTVTLYYRVWLTRVDTTGVNKKK